MFKSFRTYLALCSRRDRPTPRLAIATSIESQAEVQQVFFSESSTPICCTYIPKSLTHPPKKKLQGQNNKKHHGEIMTERQGVVREIGGGGGGGDILLLSLVVLRRSITRVVRIKLRRGVTPVGSRSPDDVGVPKLGHLRPNLAHAMVPNLCFRVDRSLGVGYDEETAVAPIPVHESGEAAMTTIPPTVPVPRRQVNLRPEKQI